MTFYRLEQFSAPVLFDYLRLRTDVFVVEQGCAYPELDEWDREAEHLLALDGQNLIACARIMGPHTAYPEPSLGRLAVAPAYRGQGWGLRSLRVCLERLHTLYPGQAVKIQAQQYLEGFYALAGFRTISPAPYPDVGVMHVDMRLEAMV
jgi:ElaA protein